MTQKTFRPAVVNQKGVPDIQHLSYGFFIFVFPFSQVFCYFVNGVFTSFISAVLLYMMHWARRDGISCLPVF